MTHYISWFLFPRQPHWFSEGVAEFTSTVGRNDEVTNHATGSHVVRGQLSAGFGKVGLMPRDMVRWLERVGGLVPSAELLGWDGVDHDETRARYHLSSWILYHYLWNMQSKALTEFQKALSAAENPDTAWARCFPQYNPTKAGALAQLDRDLDEYRRRARYAFYQVEAKAETGHQDHALSSADARALLLDARARRDLESERPLLETILREDPAQPLAVRLLAKLNHQSEAEGLRSSVQARPSDWRAWLQLGQVLPMSAAAEKEAALRKALGLNPDSAVANNDLAWLLLQQGHPKDALPLATRGVDLAPGNAAELDTLAAVAAALDHCPEALILQRRAHALVPRNTGMTARLETYEARCGAP